ncbi:MAG: hypothetical protein KatS3mg022_3583 [Armatimonadota bacterium]|nr:MAG: hypothetical protein KatS3mg022_3583 [Armatimonadota bacterium]
MIVQKVLHTVAPNLAVPDRGTILHEMVTGEPAQLEVYGDLIPIPKPNLPVDYIQLNRSKLPVVQLRPPFTTLHQITVAKAKGEPYRGLLQELARQVIGVGRNQGEYGRALLRASQYELPCAWAKLVGHPEVPEGEIWITFGKPTRLTVFQRFPQASSSSCRIRPTRRVTNYPHRAILVHPNTLVEDLQGDSDGDEGFAGYIPGEKPAPRVTITRKIHFAEWDVTPEIQPNAEFDDLYWGFTATRYIGQVIQAIWVLQYAHAARTGDPQKAACEVWDFATALIEHVMDARKLKAESTFDVRHAIECIRGTATPDEPILNLPYGKEVMKSAEAMAWMMPEGGVFTVLMRRARPRSIIRHIETPPEELLKQLWSGKLEEEYDDPDFAGDFHGDVSEYLRQTTGCGLADYNPNGHETLVPRETAAGV